MKRILIVDDSSMARMFIRQCLEAIGFRGAEFVEAKNGLEALEKIESVQIDLIVTDLTMPIMGGETLLNKIKSATRYSHIPVLIISSAGNSAKEVELKQKGALALLAKPFIPADLYKALLEFIPEQ